MQKTGYWQQLLFDDVFEVGMYVRDVKQGWWIVADFSLPGDLIKRKIKYNNEGLVDSVVEIDLSDDRKRLSDVILKGCWKIGLFPAPDGGSGDSLKLCLSRLPGRVYRYGGSEVGTLSFEGGGTALFRHNRCTAFREWNWGLVDNGILLLEGHRYRMRFVSEEVMILIRSDQ